MGENLSEPFRKKIGVETGKLLILSGLTCFHMVTDINQLDLNARYTFADYLKWAFKERVELIRGKIFRMSPAPSLWHQRLARRLLVHIDLFLEKQSCEVFIAPFDVRLPVSHPQNPGRTDTVVQPDLCVVCDPAKLDERGCFGAPDLIVEILSPGNTKKEMSGKFELYQSAGVQEYWIVDPEHQFVLKYTLDEAGKFVTHRPFTTEEEMESDVLPGLQLSVAALFEVKD